MPTFDLLPDGQTTQEWAKGTSSNTSSDGTYAEVVDATDGTYLKEVSRRHKMVFTTANPTISSSDIQSIDSVKLEADLKYTKNSSFDIDIDIRQDVSGSGNGLDFKNVIGSGPSGGYTTFTGTEETTNPSGNSWTLTDLDNLSIIVELTEAPAILGRVEIRYFKAIVSYTAAIKDNAVFFGTNF
jgi:hypothetical protein